ncbi:MAG: hypothetical protein IPM92_11880 [Saprospiraceae bacterium]|nr:hypothetical protein [Saprospiraceae bacterium]
MNMLKLLVQPVVLEQVVEQVIFSETYIAHPTVGMQMTVGKQPKPVFLW